MNRGRRASFAVIVIGLACTTPPTKDDPLALISPPLPQHMWTQYVARLDKASLLQTQKATPVLQHHAHLKRASMKSGDHGNQTAKRVYLEFQSVAWQYVQQTTPDLYVQLGRYRAQQFLAALDERIAQKRPLTIRSQSTENAGYTGLVGPFAEQALADGWQPKTLTPVLRCMFQALFVKDWADALNARIAMGDYFQPAERYCLLRWQVEMNRSGRIEDRLQAARALAASSDYPVKYNEAIVLWNAGQKRNAVSVLKSARSPRAIRLKAQLSQRLQRE
jgi:hypothetical protein